MEQTIVKLEKDLYIKTKIANIEKQLEKLNLLLENTEQTKIKSEFIQPDSENNDIDDFFEEKDEIEVNFLDLQMAEYEETMEEIENRARKEISDIYKPIHLNFCKTIGLETPKIYHNTIGESRITKILQLANLENLNKTESNALTKVLEKYKDSDYLKGDPWDGVSAKLGYHRINLKTDIPIHIKQYKLPYKLETIVMIKLKNG